MRRNAPRPIWLRRVDMLKCTTFLLEPLKTLDAGEEAEVAEALDALNGQSTEGGDKPKSMASLDGAVVGKAKKQGDRATVETFVMGGYREKPLPMILKEVDGEEARVRVLSSSDHGGGGGESRRHDRGNFLPGARSG